MNNWMTRFISLFAVVVFLGIYQFTAAVRTKDEEIGRLKAELSGAELETEALKEALETVEVAWKEQAARAEAYTAETLPQEAGNAGDTAETFLRGADSSGETVRAYPKGAESTAEDYPQGTENAAAARYVSGSYEGSGQGFGGAVEVLVRVSENRIEEIEILSHPQEDDAYFAVASGIVDSILETQTWEVDTISSATFSSTGIREAVREALAKAEA